MTHANSSGAYGSLKQSGTLGHQQQVILSDLTLCEGTRQQVAERTGFTINAVCGRVKELLNAGIIVEQGTDVSSGRKRSILVVKAPVSEPKPRQQSVSEFSHQDTQRKYFNFRL